MPYGTSAGKNKAREGYDEGRSAWRLSKLGSGTGLAQFGGSAGEVKAEVRGGRPRAPRAWHQVRHLTSPLSQIRSPGWFAPRANKIYMQRGEEAGGASEQMWQKLVRRQTDDSGLDQGGGSRDGNNCSDSRFILKERWQDWLMAGWMWDLRERKKLRMTFCVGEQKDRSNFLRWEGLKEQVFICMYEEEVGEVVEDLGIWFRICQMEEVQQKSRWWWHVHRWSKCHARDPSWTEKSGTEQGVEGI